MDKMIPQTVKVYRLDDEGCVDEDGWGWGGGKRFPVVDGRGPGLVQGRSRAWQELWSQSLGNMAST